MAPKNLDLWQNWPERPAFPPQPHKATKEKRDPTQDMQSRGQGEGRVAGTQLLWVSTAHVGKQVLPSAALQPHLAERCLGNRLPC